MPQYSINLDVLSASYLEWTARLERVLREVAISCPVPLSDEELAHLFDLPEELVPLVDAGLLGCVEVHLGTASLRICLGSPRGPARPFDASVLEDFGTEGDSLDVTLAVSDLTLALQLASQHIQVRRRNLRITFRHLSSPRTDGSGRPAANFHRRSRR